MTITGQSSLPKDDIERMVRDAEQHAAEDRRRREEAEARNSADTIVYQTEKLLREQSDKIPADEKEKVEAALNEVKEALAGSDVDRINRTLESLKTASQAMGQRMYEQASQQHNAAGGADSSGTSGGSGSEDEVVDAEIVDEPQQSTGTEGA
jgi:molecular chaperone DnaK